MRCWAFIFFSVSTVAAIIAPNTSLATVPTAYFGGNYARRGDANIAMLSKMRIIMVEKWEGHCWQDCLKDGVGSPSCQSSCGVENFILDTFQRVKKANPNVATVLYWNTLLAFPFYTAVGKFKDRGLLTVDSTTHKPIVIRNDNGMEGIFVYGFDTEEGVQLYIDTVKNLTASGMVDGFFGDKWGSRAQPIKPGSSKWHICNHECGNVTQAQGEAWNAGKAKALAAATAHVGAGPYFANGDCFDDVCSNLNGHWANDKDLRSGDPRKLIQDVKNHLVNHTYTYVSSTGDQHWTVDPNDPSSLVSQCDDQCLARFLLAVQPGAFLGTNGWDPAYERPLGDPLSDAVYAPKTGTQHATLHRNFSSGTYVIFKYNEEGSDGKGEIFWEGKAPTPAPIPHVRCGACGSTLLRDTTFAKHDVDVQITANETECCALCAKNTKCALWAWHGGTDQKCHLHAAQSTMKAQRGTISGVMNRTKVSTEGALIV